MGTFISKPVCIEATQWFKNGDHPHDNSEVLVGKDTIPFMSEGEVVRRHNDPGKPGFSKCPHCANEMFKHGWIDTIQGGHVVCPGDWIITEPSGIGYYPCKPDVFAAKYSAVDNCAVDNCDEDLNG